VVNVSKVAHLGSTKGFGDIMNIFATFVIKLICLESLTQFCIFIIQNPPMLCYKSQASFEQINTMIEIKLLMFMWDVCPHGILFWASSRNISSLHKN
jgi:hypothetical protein